MGTSKQKQTKKLGKICLLPAEFEVIHLPFDVKTCVY